MRPSMRVGLFESVSVRARGVLRWAWWAEHGALACAWGALLVTLLACVGDCWATPPNLTRIQHADFMYAPALFKDLVLEGGSLSQWQLPPAPYFFPDVFVYVLIRLVSASADVASLIAMFGQPMLAAWLLSRLVERAGAKWAAPGAVGLIALGVALFVRGGPIALFPMLVLTDHAGQALVGLVSLVLLWGAPSRARVVVVTLMAWATTVSDPVFVLSFMGPCCLLLWLGVKPVAARVLSVLALLGACAFGLWLRPKLPLAEQITSSLIVWDRTVAAWVATATNFPNPWTKGLGALTVLGFLGAALWLRAPGRALGVVLVLSVVGNVLGCFAIGLGLELPGARHIASSYLMLAALLGLLLAKLPKPNVVAWLVPVSALVLGCVTLTDTWSGLRNVGTLRSANVACVDELRSRHVFHRCVSWYWAAKPVYVQAKVPVAVTQLQPQGSFFPWINTRHGLDSGVPVDCAIYPVGEAQYFASMFGAPTEARQCEDTVVLYYEGAARDALNQRLLPLLR